MAQINSIKLLFKNDVAAQELIAANIATWIDVDKSKVYDFFLSEYKNTLNDNELKDINDCIKSLGINTLLAVPSSMYKLEIDFSLLTAISFDDEYDLLDEFINVIESNNSSVGGGSYSESGKYFIDWVCEVPYNVSISKLKDELRSISHKKNIDNFNLALKNISPPFNILKGLSDTDISDKEKLLIKLYDAKMLALNDIKYISNEFLIPEDHLLEIYKNFCKKEDSLFE